ncbi:MAG: hypothetical protein R3343_01985 [Nitriliruptorales bacterium]|nr:hypothetical protein [Nitriliruptorales bacterium]
MGGNGDDPASGATFEDELEALGFRPQNRTATGTVVWSLAFNSYLTFTLHDYHDSVLFTWVVALGEYLDDHGFKIGSGEASFHELYPARDVKLPTDVSAVEAEITRTLRALRLDLGAPGL